MNAETKTHYRKAFNSPYLSSADIVGEITLTVARVALDKDQTKKTKDFFNTCYFVEKELRPGEILKPMILNAHNSRVMYALTGSHYIEDWAGCRIAIYVDKNVRFGRDTVEGLRINPTPPAARKLITPDNPQMWKNAVSAYQRDGNFDAVLARADISAAHQAEMIKEASNETA